jgi:3-hydroxybutyrate dehydrogenase
LFGRLSRSTGPRSIRRLLTPQEVSAYAVFLAGEQAGGVTGQAVVIDGGYTAQ